METKHYYTDERNAQIVIALLKAHGIRRVIANPGTTNIAFVGSVQNDPWFQVYSGVDERHSAYMAVGMAQESGEPVVLSCTGATASRNYLPALTEAYYRKLPILALTSIHRLGSLGNLLPQMLDRSVQPRDTVRYSVQIPTPHTLAEINDCVLNVNKAILELRRSGGGPVHINLETSRISTFNTKELPPVRVIKRVVASDNHWPVLDSERRVGVWIGAHKKFSRETVAAIENFVKHFNAAVFVDHTSSYYGFGRVNAAFVSGQHGMHFNPKYRHLLPQLQIQLGEISGDYFTMGLCSAATDTWRVNEDGELRDLNGKLSHVFAMTEGEFFGHYNGLAGEERQPRYYLDWMSADEALRKRPVDFPFSNLWMAMCAHDRFPAGSIVHLGIFNSFRSWIQFRLPEGVQANCNVGGFGIDGSISTLIGASLVRPDKIFFAVVGDLAFFYDLNALGNRHIGRNIRILLVNNGCGAEFKLSSHYGSQFGSQTDDYIAAGHHFGNKSPDLVRHFASDLGFKYLTASTKEEFIGQLDEFFAPKCDASIVFECFTSPENESAALESLSRIDPYVSVKGRVKNVLSSCLPDEMVSMIGKIFK